MYTIMCGLFERLEAREQGRAETAQAGELLKERRQALLRRLGRGEKEWGGSVLRHEVRLRAQSRGSGCAGRARGKDTGAFSSRTPGRVSPVMVVGADAEVG